MRRIFPTYYLIKGLIYCWSLLPMRILHFQSSIFAFLLFHLIGYRKKVIQDNLRQAFPEKNKAEISRITKDFYLNFCEVIVETIKLMSISAEGLKRRVRHENPEVLEEMVAHGGGGIAVFSHFSNWEWLGAGMGLQLPFSTVGVYKVLKSRVFNRLIQHIRTRLGNEMITMEQTLRESLKRLRKPCYIAFLGDQSPPPHGVNYFTSFFGLPASVHLGIATISLKMNVPMYHFDIQRIRRGYYGVTIRKIPHEDLLPYTKEKTYTLTDRHVELLETIIREKPENWLWSHRRWKRKVKETSILSEKLKTKS